MCVCVCVWGGESTNILVQLAASIFRVYVLFLDYPKDARQLALLNNPSGVTPQENGILSTAVRISNLA